MTTETITLDNGGTLTVAPLTLAQVQRFRSAATSDAGSAVVEMCRASVNNAGANYDADAFGEMVTYLDLEPLQAVVLRVSGLVAKGEEPAAS